jgi:hypothetical protein
MRPRAGSPLLGAGLDVGLTVDFGGAGVPASGPSIGAFEAPASRGIAAAARKLKMDDSAGAVDLFIQENYYPWLDAHKNRADNASNWDADGSYTQGLKLLPVANSAGIWFPSASDAGRVYPSVAAFASVMWLGLIEGGMNHQLAFIYGEFEEAHDGHEEFTSAVGGWGKQLAPCCRPFTGLWQPTSRRTQPFWSSVTQRLCVPVDRWMANRQSRQPDHPRCGREPEGCSRAIQDHD